MNTLKRILGVVWILLGIVSVYYLFVNLLIFNGVKFKMNMVSMETINLIWKH